MSDKIIVITSPSFIDAEAASLNRMFERGLERLHLRKPGATAEQVMALISDIEPQYYKDISIHCQQELKEVLDLGGCHYSYQDIPKGHHSNSSTSCSVHSWQEWSKVRDFVNYTIISPVFDSISKQGYRCNKDLQEVPEVAKQAKVYALGGIDAINCTSLLKAGYYGVAVLGYLWEESSSCVERFELLRNKVDNFVAGWI